MNALTVERIQKVKIATLVVLPLVSTVWAMVLLWNTYFSLSDLVLFCVMYVLTVIGITVGYHRMLTHKGFETHPFIKGLFLILGAMAFEGTPDVWAATHIKHHAHSDCEDDPHSPMKGFWHAHFGWLFSSKNFPTPSVYAPHIYSDPVVRFVSLTTPLWVGLSLIIPLAIGGWTGFLWGGPVRVFVMTHVTWSVNSVCHYFGRRSFETSDESRNHWVVGLLAFGEGWHNNHHAFPENAFHGMRWWQFDLSGLLIRSLEYLGLVWNVNRVSEKSLSLYHLRIQKKIHAFEQLRSSLFDALKHTEKELEERFNTAIKTSLSHVDRKKLASLHSHALSRIHELRQCASRMSHAKTRTLQYYRTELNRLKENTLSSMRKIIRRQTSPLLH